MADDNGSSPSKPKSALRSPGKMRLSPSAAQGLSTITERINTPPPPPIPRRSSRRKSGASSIVKRPSSPRPWLETRSSQDTTKTAPPAYEWVPEALDGEDNGNPPVEGEKLAELRRNEGWRTPRRGGWGRLWLIVGVVFIVILALAIGLGVGLSQKSSKSSSSDTSAPSSDSGVPQKFPLGEYSFVTALMNAQTYCTSNPATWRCYPFTTFDPSSSGTDTTSLAYFNWIISNTEDDYATVDSVLSTPDSGIPANLTVSSKNDVFGITFGAKPLTYIASSSNSSSPRYTFSFTMPKSVVPSPPITTDGSAAECFFNETIFTGNIYLSASRNYPSGSSADSTSIGGYEQWPHAVEITQTASGGTNVPNCYETVDGNVGAPITTAGLIPLAGTFECLCDYRNYY